MQKTKICHVSASHKRYDRRIFEKECQSLAKAGYDVTLLVADGKESEVINGVKIQSVDISKGARWLGPGEWIIDGKRKKSKDVSMFNRIRRELNTSKYMLNDAMEVDAEIYHIHEPVLLPLARNLKIAGKKVIFDSHENHPAQIKVKGNIPYILRSALSNIYRSYETGTTMMLDAVITPCTFFDGVDIFKGRCKNTETISNAPLLSEFYEKYQHTHKDKKTPTICYVGGLTHGRGITHLIKAAYKANIRLILAGSFSPVNYENEVKKMPEYSCVDYKGHITGEQLLKVYKESSIGIATILNIGQYNTGDNFATKVYEYMSMGLPVILTNYPYAEKILQKYNFGIAVDPENIDGIASAIRFLIENPEAAKKMSENGRRAVLEEFNWIIEEKKLIKLYKKILLQ